MRSILCVATLCALTVLGGTTASATAAAQKCSAKKFGLVDRDSDAQISQLDVAGLPRLTNDYAPRCLVAEALAANLQYHWIERDKLPARVRVTGARWNAGTWRVRSDHMVDELTALPYESVTARRGRGRITLILDDLRAAPEYPDVDFAQTEPVYDGREVCREVLDPPLPGTVGQSTSEVCSIEPAIVNYDAIATVPDRPTALLAALGLRNGYYIVPLPILQLIQQADRLNVAPRYAVMRYPGGEVREAWQRCC